MESGFSRKLCASAHMEGQMLTSEGKTCSLRMSFTRGGGKALPRRAPEGLRWGKGASKRAQVVCTQRDRSSCSRNQGAKLCHFLKLDGVPAEELTHREGGWLDRFLCGVCGGSAQSVTRWILGAMVSAERRHRARGVRRKVSWMVTETAGAPREETRSKATHGMRNGSV